MAEHTTSSLTPAQSRALFDILTHRQTYHEIEEFKQPEAIDNYGPPFQDQLSRSDSPILQSLLSKFTLTLPGLSQVKPSFWQTYIKDIVQELSRAELSESYDKGTLGIRKTVATAISALLEYPARGILGGLDKKPETGLKDNYDTENAADIVQAWQDCLHEIVYGDLLDELFEKAAQTQDLKEHRSGVQAMHEYIVVNLASLIHYTLILSPEGASLLRMIENVHRLLPYTIIRQTLKIGNAATMISGMVRVMLAKVSVASMTNWMGLSAGADEGMNLMQQIISQVLGWDKRELKRRAEKIERDPTLLPKNVRVELKEWISRSRAEHDECRRQSREQGMSIVAVILSLSSVSDELTEDQHTKALEYLSLNLAIRDRQEIIKVLCQRNPDHLTAAVREAVDAYTPLIRDVHQAVDLSDTIWDFERFVTDMLKISKPNPSRGNGGAPSVEDYVTLLHNHQASSHKFLHQAAKKGPHIVEWWHTYVKKAAAQFREDEQPPSTKAKTPSASNVQTLKKTLHDVYDGMNEKEQKEIASELDTYGKYLDELHNASLTRIDAVVKKTGHSPHGPGAYLARWQDLLDRTPITPAKANGPVRSGSSKTVSEETRKDVDGEKQGFTEEQDKAQNENPKVPSVEKTWAKFSPAFQNALRGQ